MTKEELIEILKKKCFESEGNEVAFFKELTNEEPYMFITIDTHADVVDEFILLGLKVKEYKQSNELVALTDEYIKISNLTEQKIDEILSQATKIKTSLYQIEKIVEDLK